MQFISVAPGIFPAPRIREKRIIIIIKIPHPKNLIGTPPKTNTDEKIADMAAESKNAAAEKTEILRVGSELRKSAALIITEIIRNVIMHTAHPVKAALNAPPVFLFCPIIVFSHSD